MNKFDAEFKALWKRKLTDMVYGVAQECPVTFSEGIGVPAGIPIANHEERMEPFALRENQSAM